jgi:putative nucleotidyltransferase with HDIG domain
MKNNNSDKENKKPGAVKVAMHATGEYIRKNYPFLILFLAGLLAVSALNFLKISTAQTIANFSLEDFEIGQIADRTILADRSLPPDNIDPVAVTKGEKIIKKGFPITEEGYAKLKKMSASPLYIDYRAFANSELYLLLLSIMWYLLFTFISVNRKLLFKEPLLQVIFFLAVFAVTAFCGKLPVFSSPYSICVVIPSALFIMIVTILYGNLSALLLSIVMSIGVLCATNWQIPTFLLTLASSLTSAAIVRKIERRLDLVFAGLMIAVFNIVFVLLFSVIFNETFDDIPELMIGLAINGFLSGILTLGFLTPLEIILNTASVFRLMDLSDNNTPIFKQMQIQTNGTYNHSMMVAQLAEAGCREIGANSLLARVGAYYHDIGKMDQSEYFVENQVNGMENKHNDLNPTLSASVIKSHVRKGVEKARQLHLPQAVIDIISEHHGNSIITYFYNSAKEKDPSLDEDDFRYPGIPPTTKESAVVMLADTIEAACHTLENPTSQRLDKFITMLINQKVENKQLDNCDLTFRDISRIKAAFVNLLTGYYHNRIKYQNQQDPDEAPAKTEEAAAETPKEEKETKAVKEQKDNSEPVKTTKSAASKASTKTSKEKK